MNIPTVVLKPIAQAACRQIFRSVVAYFLRYGLRHNDFSVLMKEALVGAAEINLRASKEKITQNRIASVSGLSKAAVSRLRKRLSDVVSVSENIVPSGLLLRLWHTDVRFLDRDGSPRELSLDAQERGRPEFRDLCDAAGCVLPVEGVLRELEDAGVARRERNKVVVSARTLIVEDASDSIRYVGLAVSNLMETLAANTASGDSGSRYFERTVIGECPSDLAFKRFSELVNETSGPFLEVLDDWLVQRQNLVSSSSAANGKNERDPEIVGLGVYVFRRRKTDEIASTDK